MIPVACTTNKIDQKKQALANDIEIPLLEPESFGEKMSLTQSLEFEYNGNMKELLIQSEFTDERILVVGLTTNGTRLFSISYDGTNLNSEGYTDENKNLQSRYMLMDMQLSLWPFEVVNKHLNKTVSCFKNNQCQFFESENKLERTLKQNGKTMLIINYQSKPPYKGKIELINQHRDYQLIIIPLAMEKL